MPHPTDPPFPGPLPPRRSRDGLVELERYRNADGSFPARDGTNPIERMALHRANLDIAAMPAAEVVQLILWPNQIAEIARQHKRSNGPFYNALSGANAGRPYHPVRTILAESLAQVLTERSLGHLGVTKTALDHLIEAAPARHHGETPIHAPGRRDEPLALPLEGPFDPASAPTIRDGTNPIERACLILLHRQISALPASIVAQLALWPRSLAQWADGEGKDAGALYNCLAFRGGFAYRPYRSALAASLDVSEAAADWLIEARTAPDPPRVGVCRRTRPAPTRPAPRAHRAIQQVLKL